MKEIRGDCLIQRAAAYIRVSTLDQTEFSPDAQLKQIKEYANKHNMVLSDTHIYADEGISGRSTDKRLAFNRMITNAKKKPKPFDVILIHKFNRFARNREDAIIFKSLLKRDCGIKVISITEPIEDDKIGIIIESVLDAFSEYYSINLSEEVKKGMGEKASRGGVQSRPPLGYNIEKNKLIVNNYEAQVIKLIYKKFVNDGLMYIDIARELNDLGIRSKNGNLFQSKAIRYILTNPTYKGYLLWNKKEKNGMVREQSAWILAKGDYEPIISEELYEKAQKRVDFQSIKVLKNSKPTYSYKHDLSGLLICGHCGGRMVFCKSNKYTYFRCRKAKEGACSMKKSVRADILETVILNQIDSDWSSIELVTTNLDSSKDEKVLNMYTQQLKGVNNKLTLAKNAYLNGVDTLKEYQKNKELLKKEKEKLTACIKTENMDMSQISLKESIERWENISTLIENIDIDKRNRVLKAFIKEVILDVPNECVEIIYYTEDEIEADL